jgi:hypothetical protein
MKPILDHTPHVKKKIVELVIASHATNIVLGANCRSVKPQNGPILYEHVVQGLHAAIGMVLPIFAHLSTPVIKNSFTPPQ